jgi:hypothetical protein
MTDDTQENDKMVLDAAATCLHHTGRTGFIQEALIAFTFTDDEGRLRMAFHHSGGGTRVLGLATWVEGEIATALIEGSDDAD